MLLNEENGYFHQVPGWDLNCAFVGAVLAELSLLSRIDTDVESLFLVDGTGNGQPDPGPSAQGDHGAAGPSLCPILDRAPRLRGGIRHRPDAGSPGRDGNTGAPRRGILDPGTHDLAGGTVGPFHRGIHGAVCQDPHRHGGFQRRNSLPEGRHHHQPGQYLRRISLHIRPGLPDRGGASDSSAIWTS